MKTMINLEETLKIIEEEGSLEKSTKELKEAGLNNYYIRKAIESGALARISHGKYKILKVEKEIFRRQSFNGFIREVLKGNFDKAYTHLVKNLESQSNHDYDYNLKLYFLLLKEILKDQKDFSFLNDILTFSDWARNNSYYDHLIDFKEAVLSGKFDDAYQSIVLFKDAEKASKGTNHMSSILFYRLTSHIYSNNRKREYIAKTQEDEQDRNRNYVNYYEKIKSSIENDNYEEALENLEKIFPYTRPNKKPNIRKMSNIIEKYLEIKVSKETLPVLNIDYSAHQDNFNKLLNAALCERDYETAYKTIGKCIYYAPQSTTLQLYRKLLYTLIDQNKENKKLKTRQGKEESIPAESSKINIEVLTQLIYDRKYQQVKELLEDEKDERLYRIINQMIKKIESLNTGNNQPAMEHTYRSAEYRVFNRLFEALGYRDYQEAYILIEKCLEISEHYNNDTSEFRIYSYLLEDIVELEKNFDEQKKQKQELKRLRESKREILYQREITKENFQSLKAITTKLISLSSDEELASNLHIQHMLDTLESIDESYLDRSSFAEFEYVEESILEKFLKAISLGDYITAHQLTKDKKWYEENQKSPHRSDNLMYRKLLHLISDKLDTPQESFSQESTTDDTIDYSTIDHLRNLKNLLKHRKFTEALEYYQENELGDISDNLNTELEVFLHLLSQPIKREDKELQEKFISSYKTGNLEQAQEDLDNYHKFMEENNITRNTDYYNLRLISLAKEKSTPDFQEKEDLYNQAADYFQKQNYIEACEKLNSYIEKDNDLSAKGYLLRGQCLENLGNFPAAEENYERAISIIPEPSAYHHLGRLYYYCQGNYQAAVDCFLEYEKRKPKCYQNNLESLSASYQELGEEKLSIKYKTLAKNLSAKISSK